MSIARLNLHTLQAPDHTRQWLKEGSIAVGTGNLGEVVVLGSSPAKQGMFTSSVLEAARVSRWGRLNVYGDGESDPRARLITPDGKVHYYASPGVDDLTSEDHIASQYPYGFRCRQFHTFFFNVANRDDGRTWSTSWVIDDPSLYFNRPGRRTA